MRPLLNTSNWNPAAVVTSSNSRVTSALQGFLVISETVFQGGSGFIFHVSPASRGRTTITKQVVLLVTYM